MTTLYRKLRLNRVDFVDKGANPGAHITLAKRAPTEERLMADKDKELTPEAVAKQLTEANVALEKRLKEAEDKVAASEKSAKEQADVVAKVLEDRAKDSALVIAKGMDKLPGKVDETAHVLFMAKRSLDADTYAQVEKLLKACDAQIRKGALFSVVGSDNDGAHATEFDQLVAKRVAEKGEDKGTAMLAVMDTPAGKQAWNVLRGGN